MLCVAVSLGGHMPCPQSLLTLSFEGGPPGCRPPTPASCCSPLQLPHPPQDPPRCRARSGASAKESTLPEVASAEKMGRPKCVGRKNVAAEVCRPKKCDGRTQASVGRKADSVQQSRTNGTLHFWLPPRFPSVAVFGCRPFPRLWRRLWPPSSARSGASFGRPLGRPRLPSPLLPRAAPVGATLAATAAGLPDSRWGFPFQGCPRPPRLLNGVRACPTPSPRTRPRRRHRRC